MGKKERVLASHPLHRLADRPTRILAWTDEPECRRTQPHPCGLAEPCQAAANRAQGYEKQIRAGPSYIDDVLGESKCEGKEACNQTYHSRDFQCRCEVLHDEVLIHEPFTSSQDFVYDEVGAETSPIPHTQRPLTYNECSETCVAYESNGVLTNRGGAEAQPPWIGKLFGLGIAYDRYQQRIRTKVIKAVNTIRNPTGAVLVLIREFSAHVIRARRKKDWAARFNNPLFMQHITDHVTERGGAGSKPLSDKLKRDGRLRIGLRRHRQALGNHLGRVQRWLAGNRGSGSVRMRDSIPRSAGNTPAATSAATPRSTESLSTSPFPPYEDPVDSSEHPSPRSPYISHNHHPTQRGLALDEGEDIDVAPNEPGPSRMSSISPGIDHSDTDPEARDVRFSHIDWTGGLLANNSTTSSSSESVHISSLDSQDLRSIRRVCSRNH